MLSRLFERRSETLTELVGRHGTRSGGVTHVSESQALAHSAVWSAVWLIADLLSTLPVKVYRSSGGRPVEASTPTVLASPSIEVGTVDWISQHITSLLLRGNAYGIVTTRDAQGWPTSIENVNADAVMVSRDKAGRRIYRVGSVDVDESNMFHVIGRPWAGLPYGISVLDFAARNIGMGLAAETFGDDFFRSGAHPTAILSTTKAVDSTQALAVKDRFKAAVGSRDVVVLGDDLKYSPLQIAPNESQFLETIGASAVTIARWFGVPPELIAANESGQSVTYANLNDRLRSLLMFALNPWQKRLEDAYTALLPRPQYVKFATGGMLRGDQKTRYESHKLAIDAGFMTVDEVRALEELPPLGGTL
jgi:HK97 family phage portal protein